MTENHALAAGQGGTEIAPTPETSAAAAASQSPAQPWKLPHPEKDDVYRRFAVEELALQLHRGGALLAHCQAVAQVVPTNELGPLREAARLMNANAQIARALALVALVERRSKTIVERIQEPDPGIAGLNSILTPPQISPPQQRKKIRDILERGLLQFLEEQKQDRERQDGLADGSCI